MLEGGTPPGIGFAARSGARAAPDRRRTAAGNAMGRIYAKGVEIVPGFRLVKLLGRGGFGEVWQATAPGGTEAAVKIIALAERSGVKEYRSIQLVKQIRHPNLVPILAFWLRTTEGEFFDQIMGDATLARRAMDLELIIAMGLGEKNLLDRLEECKKAGKAGIPADELLGYMQDSSKAIDFLNQSQHDLGTGTPGIQHCDIKPQNILIVGGSAQVCDFGLARVLGDSRVTSAKGSAAYMAPELILENKPSKATDQYCLAVSYVELRTGALPLNIASPAAAIWAHAQGKLDLSKLSPAEQVVVKRATSVNPDQRYPSTAEMVKALRQAIEKPSSIKQSSIIRPVIASLDELIKPGGELVPGYKLLKLLGQGGYGQVWETVAPGGKHVALKIIRNLEGTHGRQEFRALELIKGVEHNHLIELHAYWLLDKRGNIIPDEVRHRPDSPDPSTLVIASKLANQNLHQRVKECQQQGLEGIPVPELMGYMKQAAQAIDYLNTPQHQLGDRRVSIQHRDIKPENILLASGVVKVGDFGLAKVVEGTQAVIHGDSAGLTLVYAAPEMFQNLVTNWSDQYSLALTYFKLRTGVLPFPNKCTPNDVIRCHLQGKLELSRLARAERAVVARATSVKPEARFSHCTAMVEELERACHSLLEVGPQSLPTLDFIPNLSALREKGSSAPSGVHPAVRIASPETPTDIPEITAPNDKPKPLRPSDPVTVRSESATSEAVTRHDVLPTGYKETGARPAAAHLPGEPTSSYHPEAAVPEMPQASPERQTTTIKRHVTAAWREKAAAKRRRRTQATAVALMVAALSFITMIGLALYAVSQSNRRGDRGDKVKGDVTSKATREKGKQEGQEAVAPSPVRAPEPKKSNEPPPEKAVPPQPEPRPPEPAAESPREKKLRNAETRLDRAALRFRVAKLFRTSDDLELLNGARKAVKAFQDGFGANDPDACAISGRLNELTGAYDAAYKQYCEGMWNPDTVGANQLRQLLARIEFLLNPRWKSYVRSLHTRPKTIVKYAVHAVTLTDIATADPVLRIRSLMLDSRARAHALSDLGANLNAAEQKDYRETAQSQLSRAKELAQQAGSWRCPYEVAFQLDALSMEPSERVNKDEHVRDALTFLRQAEKVAPDEEKSGIESLIQVLRKSR
jgi:serine/threonine protein kinase